MTVKLTKKIRKKKHLKIRSKISGTASRPRLNVFRSLQHIYAQVIDDSAGHTVVSASTLDKSLASSLDNKTKIEQAEIIGTAIAERALASGIEQVVFDRAGYKYHGRIKKLAESARKHGLKF